MKRYWMLLASLGALALVGGCASVNTAQSSNLLAQVDDATTGALETLPAVLELNGQPVLLYTSKDNPDASKASRVTLRRGEQVTKLDETARVKGGTRYQLHFQDDNLQALWWSHADGKNLYITSSADKGQNFGPVGAVNEEHGVLPTYNVLAGPKGTVGITYLDERKPNYQIYFNRSTDFGRTWPKSDQRLDTPPSDGKSSFVRDPQTIDAGSIWVSAWVDSVYEAGKTSYRIVNRRSLDAGLSWSTPEVIYSADTLIASLKLQAQGRNIVVAADEHGRGILAFHSQDKGATWHSSGHLADSGFALGTEGASNSGLAMTVNGDRMHLVWMQDRKEEKTKIMHASYDMAQSQWVTTTRRLDIKSHDNTRSISPEIIATPKGALVAAWVDYRDIRPNIYLSASFDQGQVWSAPQALLKPGEAAGGWPRLMPWRDQIAISYESYPTDRMAEGKFILQLIPISDGAKALPAMESPNPISDADKKKKLEQRAKALWEARVAGDYETSYRMFDFAYRASTPLKFYTDNVGTITYLSFSIGDSTIEGNEAQVKSKLKYEVKQTMLPAMGKPISVAPVEVDITNTWVWVGNDWYLVYSPSYDKPILKY